MSAQKGEYNPQRRHLQYLKMKSDPEKYAKHKARTRDWFSRNKEYCRIKGQDYRRSIKDTPRYKQRMNVSSKKYYHARKDNAEWSRHHLKNQIGLRDRMIDAYGAICACCGETIREFLTLSHINHDGAEERRMIGKNPKIMWRKAIAERDSGRYELLCWNCNAGAKSNKGICPHKQRRGQ